MLRTRVATLCAAYSRPVFSPTASAHGAGDAYVCKEAKTDPTWNLVGGSKKEKDQDVHSGAVRAATGKIGK
jgi:hypothetical protein